MRNAKKILVRPAALALCATFAFAASSAAPQGGQGGGGARQGPRLPSMAEALKDVDLYPAERPTSVLHFYAVEGEPKMEALTKAFGELKTDKAACRIAYGPEASAARPKIRFVAVEAPVAAKAKDVERALERGGWKAEALSATCFQGPQRRMGGQGFLGQTPRDWLIGTSGDLRWCETLLGFSEFFHLQGKLDAKSIADRVKKLGEPFGQGDIGQLVLDTFTWRLEGELDEAKAKKLEKLVAKLPGVARASIDAGAKTLALEVALEDLRTSGIPIPLPIPEEFRGFGEAAAQAAGTPLDVPRVRWDTHPLWLLLDKEALVPRTIERAKPAGEAAAPGGEGQPQGGG